mgnify:CR=1 FL=1
MRNRKIYILERPEGAFRTFVVETYVAVLRGTGPRAYRYVHDTLRAPCARLSSVIIATAEIHFHVQRAP